MATPDEVLADLWDELGKGRVVEAFIKHDVHLDGLCSYKNGTVVINPATNTVLTLIHELMHRRWPRWSEKKVARESEALFCAMSEADVKRWYRAYQRAKRVSRRTVKAK
jgi:hypothetical protein